jgi:hypothetical protein
MSPLLSGSETKRRSHSKPGSSRSRWREGLPPFFAVAQQNHVDPRVNLPLSWCNTHRIPVPRKKSTCGPKSKQRTKVENGTQLWANVDGLSLWARRAGELLVAHIADFGG